MLPEHPIVISPTLAATIGLEEAVLLQTLSELVKHCETNRPGNSRMPWQKVEASLLELLPFWAVPDLRRVRDSLHSLGLIALEKSTIVDSPWVAIEATTRGVASAVSTPQERQAEAGVFNAGVFNAEVSNSVASRIVAGGQAGKLIPENWRPDENWIALCKQHSIPDEFIQSLIPEFVAYWRDRKQARPSWGNAFYKKVLREWCQEQTRRGAHDLTSTLSPQWKPDQNAIKLLIPEGWQPSAECYEIFRLAEIDEDYARSKVPEFVMYYKDSKQVKASWNIAFLRWVEKDWAWRLEMQSRGDNYAEDQAIAGSTEEKVRARLEQLADRSWAD